MPNELSTPDIVIISTVIPIVITVLTIYTCLKYKEKILYEKRMRKLESTRNYRNYREEIYGVKDTEVQINVIRYETYSPQSDIEKERYIKNKKNNTTMTH